MWGFSWNLLLFLQISWRKPTSVWLRQGLVWCAGLWFVPCSMSHSEDTFMLLAMGCWYGKGCHQGRHVSFLTQLLAFPISAPGLCHHGLKCLSTQGCPAPLGIFPYFLHSVFLCPLICVYDGERHALPVPGHKEYIESISGNVLRTLGSCTAGDGGI